MFLRKQSISRDLTVALVLVVLGVCCLVIAVNFAISSRKIQSELEQKAEEIVSYLAKTLEMPLWHIDKEGIRKIGNLYASNELISELRITDESTGQILYTHQPSAEKELVEKSRKILHDGELIGSLLIGLKPDNYRQSNQRLLRTSILIMLASIITVILAAGVLLRFFLERPFNDLITGLDRIAAGDYKYRFETWKKREIRAIISKFNHMAEQVRVRQRSLHKINQRLQKEIAEHKESEQALRKSEEKYRSILETIEDGYYEIDLDSTFRFGNESLAGIYGCSEQELLGRKMRDFTDDETATMGYRHFNEVYRTGIPKIGFSWEIITKNGGRRHVETSISLIKDTDGKAVGFRGIMRDVTDRLLSEKALRENEGRLRAIFEANPDPVVVYDRRGHPQYLNPAFTQVFGWSLGELLGKRIPFVPDDQEAISSAKISELYESGQPIRVETKRFTKDGRILDILVSAAMIKGSEGEPSGMVVNLTDITERKKLEAQFQAAQRMESLGTLAGGIAHNFNNLLMAILGNASLMLLDKDSQHPDYDKLRGIEQHVHTGADLTKQLLGLARGGKYEVKPTDLNQILKQSSEMFAKTKKELSIHQKYQDDIWIVEADQGQFEQILMNLYVNASQAMPRGGQLHLETENVVLDEGYVRPYEVKPGRYVKLSVADTGVGMDQETLRRVFEPFFTTKEMGRGTGLGLASVYGIVKSHGGVIDVYSKKGQGATFSIYLPASEKAAIAAGAEEDESDGILEGNETVLLVDDEEMVIAVGRNMLENLGYKVLAAKGGEEALQVFEEEKDAIDLVILDMIMPEISGGDTFDRLKEIHPNIKVLLSSGYSINEQAQDILRRGCKGFIQKPFNIQNLSRKLRQVLDAEQLLKN